MINEVLEGAAEGRLARSARWTFIAAMLNRPRCCSTREQQHCDEGVDDAEAIVLCVVAARRTVGSGAFHLIRGHGEWFAVQRWKVEPSIEGRWTRSYSLRTRPVGRAIVRREARTRGDRCRDESTSFFMIVRPILMLLRKYAEGLVLLREQVEDAAADRLQCRCHCPGTERRSLQPREGSPRGKKMVEMIIY